MRISIFVLVLATVFVRGDTLAFDESSRCGGVCYGTVSPPNAVVLMCPQGDTPTCSEQGVIITLPFGAPVPEGSIYALEACGNITFCVPPQVDGPLEGNGLATFSGAVFGGGYTDKWLWASGWIPEPLCIVVEVDVRLVSPDINADLKVNLQDLALFAMAWPPLPYDARADLDGDSVIGLVDLWLFSQHLGHECD